MCVRMCVFVCLDSLLHYKQLAYILDALMHLAECVCVSVSEMERESVRTCVFVCLDLLLRYKQLACIIYLDALMHFAQCVCVSVSETESVLEYVCLYVWTFMLCWPTSWMTLCT